MIDIYAGIFNLVQEFFQSIIAARQNAVKA